MSLFDYYGPDDEAEEVDELEALWVLPAVEGADEYDDPKATRNALFDAAYAKRDELDAWLAEGHVQLKKVMAEIAHLHEQEEAELAKNRSSLLRRVTDRRKQ